MLKLSCMMGDKFRGEPVATETFIYYCEHCLEESKRGETEVCSHGNVGIGGVRMADETLSRQD